MALRLGKFLGNGPDFWLNLQRDHDLRTLEPKMAEELAAIEPVAARQAPGGNDRRRFRIGGQSCSRAYP